MEYRKLPHGSELISVIGLGASSLGAASHEEMLKTLNHAFDAGVNYVDLAAGHAPIFKAVGEALKGRRKDIYLQIHFGAEYSSKEYGWTTNLKRIKESIQWQLECLQTDYIDFGFIHCIDEEQDLKTIQDNGVLDYILDLKKKGIIHYIGLSSHSPKLVHQVLDMNILDVVMFSINPAYDLNFGDYAIGEFDERMNLYRRLEKEGVGISVMKAFCGGKLLDVNESPFHQALTETQCMQYALDKPAVLTALPGVRNDEDLTRILHYLEASDEEKDYSILGTFPKLENYNQCVYCKHCHPCPKGLDIALINKYYDLARLGDELAADHYHHLALKASDCIVCHHCDKRCPFHVQQSKRMQKIADYFHE